MLLPLARIYSTEFHRIEFRSVRRKVFNGDLSPGRVEEFTHQAAPVGGQPVPDHQQRKSQMTEKIGQKGVLPCLLAEDLETEGPQLMAAATEMVFQLKL